MSGHEKDVGKRGEDIAAAYLQAAGYRILRRNYRFGRLELDMICHAASAVPIAPDTPSGKGEIVFVEVKTRSGFGFGRPEEAVSATKQRRIAQAAQAWLREQRMERTPCRFDVIAVVLRKNAEPVVTHFKQAFWVS